LFDAAVVGAGGGPPGNLGVNVHDGFVVIGGGLIVPGWLVSANGVGLPVGPEQALDRAGQPG
jgi:hypothetical protein